MKILFLPIDNRPVCYQLPKLIADMNEDIELILPPRKLLGGLHKQADVDGLFKWLSSVKKVDSAVLSLDTIAYGGLIPSRRSPETFEDIKNRIEKLKQILVKLNAKIFAFSSVMRISNNNINQEEKKYWNLYGEKLFKYSYELHKYGKIETDIPQEILNDYITTRKRNFEINKIYLEWQKQGLFDTLIFSKDDCAEFGFNVKEAQELEDMGGITKTGADEIPLTLLARSVDTGVNVCPFFLEPEYKNLISNYEDVSIEKSVLGQLELAGCDVSDMSSADVLLVINNFKDHQGEIVMKRPTVEFDKIWLPPDKNYAVADVRFANGADNAFIEQLFDKGLRQNFLGYSAWNTSANTLGSLICAVKVLISAKNAKKFQPSAFKRLQAVRFLDDWAYQANVRQQLTRPDVKELSSKMKIYEERVGAVLNSELTVTKYSFPWDRLFEVEIGIN